MSRALRLVAGVAILAVGFFVPAALPFLLPIGASLALGAVLEPKPQNLSRLQNQSVMVRSAIQPQEVVYGMTRKSGVVVWFDASGSTNEYLWFVIAVCEHEIDSYVKLWIDEVEIDIDTQIDVNGYVTNAAFVDADSNKLVKTGFYLGAASQTADAELVAAFANWDSTHNGNDVAYFWVRLQLDKSEGGNDPDNPSANIWSKGWPRDLSVTIKGKKVYDPRLDSTMVIDSSTDPDTYGVGAHRADTASTWAWSENSVLCRADYLRSSRFGPGYTSAEIDWQTVAAQADIADELASLPDAATQARYTINGVISTADTPKSIIEAMQSADHGTTLFLPAGVQVLAGAWEASSHTIDETWLAGQYSAVSSTSTDSGYNAVRGQYMAAAEGYALVEFNPRTSSAYETEDDVGRVWHEIVLPFVTDELRAQRMAIIELKKSRQQTVVKMQCNFRAELVQVYQVVTLDLPGFSSVTFRVVGKASSTDGTVTLDMRQEVSSDWTYTVPELAAPPVIPTVTRGQGMTLPPSNLTAETVANGIYLTWTNPPGYSNFESIEIYAATANNRAGVLSRITRTKSESYLHVLAEGTERYYWILARGANGLVSTWEPVGATNGVYGIAGSPGVDGVFYYIQSLDGLTIKNSAGSITLLARKVEGALDSVLTTGTIKMYDPLDAVVGTGYSATLNAAAIDEEIIITLKDGVSGDPLYTISLTDLSDGLDGLTVILSNEAHVFPASAAGVVSDYTGSGTIITVLEGGTELAYDGAGITAGKWKATASAINITANALPWLTVGNTVDTEAHSAMSNGADQAGIQYTISGQRADGVAFSTKKYQSFSKSSAGVDAISTSLTNQSPIIPCDVEGFNYPTYVATDTYITGAGGTFKVYQGNTDITDTVALMYAQDSGDGWTADGTKWKKNLDSGVQMFIDRNTGVYAVKLVTTPYYRIWDETAPVSVTMRVLVDGTYYYETFTMTKANSGSSMSVVIKTSKITGYETGGTSSATIKFDGDGYIYSKYDATSYVQGNQWLLAGTNSEYSIRASLASGDPAKMSGTYDSFLDMATDREFTLTQSAGGIEQAKIDFEIQRDTSSEVIRTGYVNLQAEYDVT